MNEILPYLILGAGIAQLCVLVASSLVPFVMKWQMTFDALPKLHQQLYWVYGGYVVLAIISLGGISIINYQELASGSMLARCVCGYITLFWGIRVSLQPFLDAKEYLQKSWFLRLGYHTLTILFLSFTIIFGYAALRPMS